MKLRDKIKVESLDEERLTNIERKLVVGVSAMQPEPVQRRGFLFATTGMVAVAAAAVIGWKLHAVPVVDVPAAVPQHFAVANNAITLDGATLGGNAAYDVTREPNRVVIQMKQGALDLAVVHDPNRTLLVRAADTEIEDVGTKFHVDFDGVKTVAVRVTEGEVKVTRGGRALMIAAGSEWSSTDNAVVAIAVPVVAIVTPPPVIEPQQQQHPVVAEHPVVQHPHPVQHVAEPVIERHPLPSPTAVDPYVELRTAIRKVPLEFAPNIDGHTDAAGEIAKLKKIAYSPTTLGPEASQAMYQIAALLYRPLGQDAEALRTLDVYQRRFNGGKELHAAMWLRVRIDCSRAFDEECRRAAYSYQHAAPSGDAADVAIRITNAQ